MPPPRPLRRTNRHRFSGLASLAAVATLLSGCTGDVPGPSPTSPVVSAARGDTRPLFEEAMAVRATPGMREVARATEDWCFSEGGEELFGPAAELSTVCLFNGGIVYALNDADQQAAAVAVDEFLATNDMYGPEGTVVDSLVGVDLMQGGELSGGGGRNLPGGGGGDGAASVRWMLVAASRFDVSGLPLSEGFNRQSYEGTITESTPADVSASGASFVLTVQVVWRYFSGKRA